MQTIKSLRLNGEEIGRGVNMYFAIQDARKKGHKTCTVPTAALAAGKQCYQDRSGKWEFIDTKETEEEA